nr:hypothetical protein BCT18_21755 [Vibrio cyclitrophicus]
MPESNIRCPERRFVEELLKPAFFTVGKMSPVDKHFWAVYEKAFLRHLHVSDRLLPILIKFLRSQGFSVSPPD